MALTNISQLSPDLKAALPQGQNTLSASPTPAASDTTAPDTLPLTPNAAGPGSTLLGGALQGALAKPANGVPLDFNARAHAGTNAAAAATPPEQRNQPGAWARQLISGAQSALSGAGQDFTEAKIPEGNHGILGGLMAVQDAKAKRLQAAKVAQTTEDRERGLIAYSNTQNLIAEQTLHAMKGKVAEQANDESIQHGVNMYKMAVTEPAAYGLEPGKIIAGGGGNEKDISESEYQKILNDGTWDPTKEFGVATSKIPSMDGNKPRLDSDGNPVYEKRWTVFSIPPVQKLSKEAADVINANIPGSNWEEGQEMPGATALQLMMQARGAHAAAAAKASDMEEADIKLESLEHSKAQIESNKVLDADNDYQKARAHIHGLENLAMYVTGQAPTGRLIPEIGPDGKPTGRTVPEIDLQSAKYAKDHPNALVDIRNSYGFDKKTGESIFDKVLEDQQQKEQLAREKKSAELPKTLEDATAQLVAAEQSGDPVKIKNAKQQKDAAYADRVKEAGDQAQQQATASGKDVESMVKTGVNPITKERLNLLNAPDAALVDRHGLPVPTDMVSLYKPSTTEKTTADTARQVLAISNDLRSQIATHPNLIGPLMGRDQKGLAKLGYSSTDAQKLLDDVSFLQSAATKMHTSRFSNEILNKMGAMIDAHMSPQAFTGGLNSIDEVANRYALEDQLITVAQYNQLARQQDVPAGQSLIQDSRGHYQTVPTTALDKAKQLDPKLQVIK